MHLLAVMNGSQEFTQNTEVGVVRADQSIGGIGQVTGSLYSSQQYSSQQNIATSGNLQVGVSKLALRDYGHNLLSANNSSMKRKIKILTPTE